jgi:hypothetical protein
MVGFPKPAQEVYGMPIATYVREQAKVFGRHTLRLGLTPHLIVASFHEVSLQLNGVFDICVILNSGILQASLFDQSLQHGMEVGAITHAQKQQQVKTSNLAALASAKIDIGRVLAR